MRVQRYVKVFKEGPWEEKVLEIVHRKIRSGNTYKYDHNEECCKIGTPCHPHTDKSVVFTGDHIPEIKQKHSCHNSSGTSSKYQSN